MKHEQTGKRAATIAGKILKQLKRQERVVAVFAFVEGHYENENGMLCTVDELKILAASALTQAPDKPKRKAKGAKA